MKNTRPPLPPILMNTMHRQPERGKVGNADGSDQVQRRDQAAQHQGQQDADGKDRDRDDPLQVAGGDVC